jgi:diadenosine tetraphosphate (Ap4A) HIT family hydrolase
MDVTSFSDTDLTRLALSSRLRELSEVFRVAVAADDGPGFSQRLFEVLATDVPGLQKAIVGHLRSSGGSWADIAALASVGEDEARARWGSAEVAPAEDPVAEAAALDEWYLRHAQLEPLAHVRDPFTRLLTAFTPVGHECAICVKYQGEALPAYGGYTSPPGGHLFDDGMFRVGHGPTPYWPAGTLLIESHRHFLDFAEMTDAEAVAIGPLIRRFTGPVRAAMDAPRVHVFSCMEGAEHFHVWLVPRTGETSSGRAFIANPGYCSIPEAEAAIARIREVL